MMYTTCLVIYVFVAIAIIMLVLLQQGKGASLGAGISTSLFGPAGSSRFMLKATSVLAVLFFVLSVVLGNLTLAQAEKQRALWSDLQQPPTMEKQPEMAKQPIQPAQKQESDIPQ